MLSLNLNLSKSIESLFRGLSTLNPVLEDLHVHGEVTPAVLLPLVCDLSKFGNLARLMLCLSKDFFEDAKSFLVLDCLQSCPRLTELTLYVLHVYSSILHTLLQQCGIVEMDSAPLSCLEPLLVNKLKVISLYSVTLNISVAEALSHSLQSQQCRLVTLTLVDCSLSDAAFKKLVIGIGKNTSLRSISFLNCFLGWSYFKVLNDALVESKTLKKVQIGSF